MMKKKLALLTTLLILVSQACESPLDQATMTQEATIATYVSQQVADTANTFGMVANNGSYRLIKRVGAEPAAAPGDSIYFVYIGYLFSSGKGAIFDTNIDTLKFTSQNKIRDGVVGVGNFIPGLDNGLIGMKTGEKAEIVFPTSQAYGDAPIGLVPPLSALLFEIEMIKVKKQ